MWYGIEFNNIKSKKLGNESKDSGGGVLTSVIGEAEDINYGEKPALKTRQ
jgi:hypothetical protein